MCARGPTPAECGTALRNVVGSRISACRSQGTALLATTMDPRDSASDSGGGLSFCPESRKQTQTSLALHGGTGPR